MYILKLIFLFFQIRWLVSLKQLEMVKDVHLCTLLSCREKKEENKILAIVCFTYWRSADVYTIILECGWVYVKHMWGFLCVCGFSMAKKEEGRNVLFNDAFNTFYLWLYGVRHMVKYHTYNERGNPLPPHGLLFPINSKGYFICTIPQTGWYIPWPLLHQSWSTGWNEK